MLSKSKFVWATIFLIVIAVEHWYQPGLVGWFLGNVILSNVSASWQLGVSALIVLMAVLFVAVFGWFGVFCLALLAVWPLADLDFGIIDEYLDSAARVIGAWQGKKSLRELGKIFWYLHHGALLVAAAIVWGAVWRGYRYFFPKKVKLIILPPPRRYQRHITERRPRL